MTSEEGVTIIKIKKILNTSVILVENNNEEFIMFGKGIGFNQKVGNVIEEKTADQVFMPVANNRTKELIKLLDSIPPAFIDLTQDIVLYAEKTLETKLNSGIFFTLMDHLNFAVERYKQGINITNKIYWEIKSYYSKEFNVGQYALDELNKTFNVELPKEEAANIAFHIINAHGNEHAKKNSIKYAKMIGSIVNLVKYTMNIDLDENSIHFSRFVTHVKFFVERFFSNEMLEEDDDLLFQNIANLYPEAMTGAFKIKEYIYEVYSENITNDELTYLAVHIHRLMAYDQFD